jgi:hypothetical protein
MQFTEHVSRLPTREGLGIIFHDLLPATLLYVNLCRQKGVMILKIKTACKCVVESDAAPEVIMYSTRKTRAE